MIPWYRIKKKIQPGVRNKGELNRNNTKGCVNEAIIHTLDSAVLWCLPREVHVALIYTACLPTMRSTYHSHSHVYLSSECYSISCRLVLCHIFLLNHTVLENTDPNCKHRSFSLFVYFSIVIINTHINISVRRKKAGTSPTILL